ncbi:MAG: hypothetical protein HC880_16355 [Bacteroidia bacterium]|nr:hypothetical protein [Bacteroidia bacterium]
MPGEHRSQAISPDLQAYLGSRPVGIHPEAEDDVFNHLSQTLDMTNLEKWKFIAVDYLSNQIKHIRIYPLGDSLQMQWIPQRQPLRCFPTPIKNSINIRGVCKS